ncbi:MAG TPA: UDP-forming cellulose synthase catalytic subunit [Myxococcales bacterium]|nr:UDP-forming cellulose synthase catalytic subunit [Myxococcales bacterium]
MYALDETRRGLAAVPTSRSAGARRSRRPLRRTAYGASELAAAIFALACVGLFVVTPLDLRTQFALAAGTFLAAIALGRLRSGAATLALIVLSVAVTGRYLYWRITTTAAAGWSLDTVLAATLLAAELYSCAMLLLAYAQSIARLPRGPVPMPEDVARWPTVDVFVPTYNESLETVRATVLAAAAMDWPADRLRVYLLDDGRREAFRDFARDAGVEYVTRPDNRHAKAGNLNHALAVTHGEFIAIFDCDHVPTRSFLQVAMGWLLRDPDLALVQTPHHFYSPDPFSRNLSTAERVPGESDLFYGVIQPGIDTWNASFFCGSCAVLRRSALNDVGGVAVDTVTEDAHTALKMHRKGWRTAYLDVPQAAGLATETLAAHVGQRIRWARGMAQIFRVDNPLLGRGLKPSQRLCYLAAMLHFFSGIPRLVFLLAPVAYLVFGRHIFNALPLAAVAYGLPHLAHSTACNARIHGRFRHSFWSEVYETCLAWYISVPTTLALLAPRRGRFNVTPKGERIGAPYFDARIARPYLLLAAVNVAALAAGISKLSLGTSDVDSLAINLTWAVHNLIILAAAIAAACELPQVRSSHRVPVELPAMLRFNDGRTMRCETRDLGRDGASVVLPVEPRLSHHERVWLSLFTFGEEHPLPAEVVERDSKTVRVRFTALALDQERHLVRSIFSRADAWLGWTHGYKRDRPLLTLASIACHGFVGVGRALALTLVPARGTRVRQLRPAFRSGR